MKIQLFATLRNYKISYLKNDIFSGLIIAAVSIPIAMGYAQISGIPAIYGLYGSVFPILLFALLSTSRQFIFGVDAAPAAIVGGALSVLGVSHSSYDAMQYVPAIALFAGLWLLVFYFLHADKIVDFISTPVMGGFISGIALTIILMQIPKLMGSSAGSGEFMELALHIYHSCKEIHVLSLVLGIAALVIIRISKKYIPKFPIAIVIMAAGVLCTKYFHIENYGVGLLQAVDNGLPKPVLIDFSRIDISQAVGRGLMVSVVIMAETLLAENNFAFRNGYPLNDRQEILACAGGNLAAALVGCCPVNGSISRTSMNEQYKGHSQVVSLTAGITMAVILLFFTGFIGYLPIPILTSIVISALMDVVETHLAIRLFHVSKNEFYIFMVACISVLFLGTIYGVIIGILLSFIAVILKATNPPRAFLGMIPGKDGYYDLAKNRFAYPIKGVILYRFSENLFFANIKIFQQDLEKGIHSDTKVIVVDAGAINSIDITAADHLEAMIENFQKRGISFYFTEHSSQLNVQFRKLGLGHLIKEGVIRRTILAAFHDAGLTTPYPLAIPEEELQTLRLRNLTFLPAETEHTLEEFSWAYGEDTVQEIEKEVHHIMEQIHQMPDMEQLLEDGLEHHLENWHTLGAFDEDEILRRIELHVDELPPELTTNYHVIIQLIEKRRQELKEHILTQHPEVHEILEKHRDKLEKRLQRQNPEAMEKWEHFKKHHL